MATKTLTVEISEDLYGKLLSVVTEKGGLWRSRRPKETFEKAFRSAVEVALSKFLEDLEGKSSSLPEFRDYILCKYPELDADLITMLEDLILRAKQQKEGGDSCRK